MLDKQLLPCLEAVLFAVGEPIEIERLAQALQEDETVIDQALQKLHDKYNNDECGICLLKLDNKYQICTKKQYADSIRAVIEVKKNAPLSQAAFEVLAIIAYNQPVTKSFVEQVRGVDCSGVIANLCQKSLIEEKGRLELPGRPLIYGTTSDFLRCFSLSSLNDLPPVPQKNEAPESKKDENNSDELKLTVDENENIE